MLENSAWSLYYNYFVSFLLFYRQSHSILEPEKLERKLRRLGFGASFFFQPSEIFSISNSIFTSPLICMSMPNTWKLNFSMCKVSTRFRFQFVLSSFNYFSVRKRFVQRNFQLPVFYQVCSKTSIANTSSWGQISSAIGSEEISFL